jgi:hypothetical protein
MRGLPAGISAGEMRELDRRWSFTESGNSEILSQWLLMAIRAGYEPAYPALERFLVEVGRRKFVKPLFEALRKAPGGRERAQAIYAKARPGYHPITQSAVDALLK